jgi:hypothetical protein
MSNIKQDPFPACAKVYGLSPGNVQTVNDCCYQSCYRNGSNQKCIDGCRQAGREILTRVMDRTPCGYGRRFVAPPTHDKISIVGDLIKQGVSLPDAVRECISCASTEEEINHCKVDALSFYFGDSSHIKENFEFPTEKEIKGSIFFWITFIVLFIFMSYLIYRGTRQLIFSK